MGERSRTFHWAFRAQGRSTGRSGFENFPLDVPRIVRVRRCHAVPSSRIQLRLPTSTVATTIGCTPLVPWLGIPGSPVRSPSHKNNPFCISRRHQVPLSLSLVAVFSPPLLSLRFYSLPPLVPAARLRALPPAGPCRGDLSFVARGPVCFSFFFFKS